MESRDEPQEATVNLRPGGDGSAGSGVTEPTAEGQSTRRRIGDKVRQRLFTAPLTTTRIGRFIVLEQLGRGGMGVVYAAYDEQLDRKVAVKVLLEDEIPEDEDRLRLLREAQALARLSHPHVVTVHEAGEHEGQIFLAMEYIPGESLGDWLRTDPPWTQVLDAFIAAGRGLGAAHAEGLVHRDFKPHNVMRSEDGVVKVLDFGLARVATDMDAHPTERTSVSGSQSALPASLTRTGTVLGTPAYMAPEQLFGEDVDARSDQYGFCVALWEGLVGRRPFANTNYAQLVEERLQGPPAWPKDAPPIPRPIVEAIRKGLSPQPVDRWPSMDTLLATLHLEPPRHRGRWFVGLLGVGVLAIGGMATMQGSQPGAEPCTGARQQLDGIWDDARSAEVEAAVLAVGPSYAAEVWSKTQRELSSYADAWTTMHTDACEATVVRRDQSARVMDLRMLCLARAAEGLRATVDTLADADAKVVQRAHELVAALRPLSRCEATEALEAEVEPPLPEEAAAVDEARWHLARARSLRYVGRYAEAREAAETAERAIQGLAYEPIVAEQLFERGNVHRAEREFDDARVALSESVRIGVQWGQRRLAAEATINLMHIVGYQIERPEEAMMLEPLALALTAKDVGLRTEYRDTRASILLVQGKLEEGETEIREVIAMREAEYGSDHITVIDAYNTLGNNLANQDRYAEAEEAFGKALGAQLRVLGPQHISVGFMKGNLVMALQSQGKFQEALVVAHESLTLIENALGPDHPNVAGAHNNLGNVLKSLERLEEAESHFRVAHRLWSATHGPDAPSTLIARGNLANLLHSQGKNEEAEAENRALLAIRLETLSPEHPEIATIRHNLASVLQALERYPEAEAEMRAALAINLEVLGPESLECASERELLAGIYAAQGKYAEAEAELRTSLATRRKVMKPDDPALAATQAQLDEVLSAAAGSTSDEATRAP